MTIIPAHLLPILPRRALTIHPAFNQPGKSDAAEARRMSLVQQGRLRLPGEAQAFDNDADDDGLGDTQRPIAEAIIHRELAPGELTADGGLNRRSGALNRDQLRELDSRWRREGRSTRNTVMSIIRNAEGPIDYFAYFGHGGGTSLPSARLNHDDLQELATALAQISAPVLTISLWACSTGAHGGFAEKLQKKLRNRGISAIIYAHTTAGHMVRNPNKVKLSTCRDEVYSRSSPLYAKFITALNDPDFWPFLPFLSDRSRDELVATYPAHQRGRATRPQP